MLFHGYLFRILLTSLFIILSLSPTRVSGQSLSVIGADVSYLDQIEQKGGIFRKEGVPKDALTILKELGFTHIRLRLWHSPAGEINGLNSTIAVARRAKALGLQCLLDIHYSDTWADPGNQSKPAVWNGLSFLALRESVYHYTVSVMERMKRDSVFPAMVQIGNETICGMLWDEGNVCGGNNTALHWYQYGALVKEGIRAVRETEPDSGRTSILLHVDRGGDSTACRWFFDNFSAQQIPFDIIGLTYYPWWQGTLSALDANIRSLTARYDKDVLVVETAYPWTMQWNDDVNNIVGQEDQLLAGYPATIAGQRKFLRDLSDILREVPGHRVPGFFYWAPENISVQGLGSVWENVTLFDFSGNSHSNSGIFTHVKPSFGPRSGISGDNIQLRSHPNPFNAGTVISFTLTSGGFARLSLFDISGREILIVAEGEFARGEHRRAITSTTLASGVYWGVLKTPFSSGVTKILLLR